MCAARTPLRSTRQPIRVPPIRHQVLAESGRISRTRPLYANARVSAEGNRADTRLMNANQRRPHAASNQSTNNARGVTFYWELSDSQRAEHEPYGFEEEGYLALDLNHGLALLQVQLKYEEWPDVPEDVGEELAFEVYYDAVAAILQVAAWNGHDPVEVCEEALSTRESIVHLSTRVANERINSHDRALQTGE